MSGFELNKIAAAVLVAGIVALVSGNVADILYRPDLIVKNSGFKVAGASVDSSSADSQSAQAIDPFESLDIIKLVKEGNADNGKNIAKKCAVCHSFNKGEPNRVGPNLWNVVGSKFIDRNDFAYSNAFKNANGTWDYKSLALFIHKPSKFLPGTKMTFAGLSKPEDVADVIAFLRTLSDSPPPLPN